MAQWFLRTKVFKNNHQSITGYLLSSPILKGCDLFWKVINLYQMILVQSLVTIFSGQWLWRKKIFKFRQYSFAISLLSPLEKRRDTSFRGSGNPLPDVPSVVKIGSVNVKNECISALMLLSSVWKENDSSSKGTRIPLPFVNWTNGSWEDEHVKIRTDGRLKCSYIHCIKII